MGKMNALCFFVYLENEHVHRRFFSVKRGSASRSSYPTAHFLLDVKTQFIYKRISRVPIWLEAKTNKQKYFAVFCFAEQIIYEGCGWACLH